MMICFWLWICSVCNGMNLLDSGATSLMTSSALRTLKMHCELPLLGMLFIFHFLKFYVVSGTSY